MTRVEGLEAVDMLAEPIFLSRSVEEQPTRAIEVDVTPYAAPR